MSYDHLKNLPFTKLVSRALSAYRLLCIGFAMLVMVSSGHAHPDFANQHTHEPKGMPTLAISDESRLLEAKVVRILDGDTVLVDQNGKKIRIQLMAANAPEYIPSDRTPERYSIEARKFLVHLILDEPVLIQYDPIAPRDRFGRRAAYLFRSPEMLCVNLELIRQGYAKYDVEQDSVYAEVFSYYNARAKMLARGIWNPRRDDRDAVIDWKNDDTERAPSSVDQAQPSQAQSDATDTQVETGSTAADDGDMVCVTKSGTRYHKKGCSHLSEPNHAISKKEAKKDYLPCKSCNPDG